jgi:hypothetical protein
VSTTRPVIEVDEDWATASVLVRKTSRIANPERIRLRAIEGSSRRDCSRPTLV